jgi:outer membrane protein assembly factor BamB
MPAQGTPTKQRRRSGLIWGISAAAVVVVGGGLGLYFGLTGGDASSAGQAQLPDFAEKPDELWQWQPDVPRDLRDVVFFDTVGETSDGATFIVLQRYTDFVDEPAVVIALDTQDGTERWTFDTRTTDISNYPEAFLVPGSRDVGVAIFDVDDNETTITMLDGADGSEQSSFQIDGQATNLNVIDGVLVASITDDFDYSIAGIDFTGSDPGVLWSEGVDFPDYCEFAPGVVAVGGFPDPGSRTCAVASPKAFLEVSDGSDWDALDADDKLYSQVADRVLVVENTDGDGSAMLFDAAGNELWDQEVEFDTDMENVVAINGTIFRVSIDDFQGGFFGNTFTFTRLNEDTGQDAWADAIEARTTSLLVGWNVLGTWIVMGDGRDIVGYSLATGAEGFIVEDLIGRDDEDGNFTAFAISDRYLYFLVYGSESFLTAIDPNAGEEVWRTEIDRFPIITDQRHLYLAFNDTNTLHRLA